MSGQSAMEVRIRPVQTDLTDSLSPFYIHLFEHTNVWGLYVLAGNGLEVLEEEEFIYYSDLFHTNTHLSK